MDAAAGDRFEIGGGDHREAAVFRGLDKGRAERLFAFAFQAGGEGEQGVCGAGGFGAGEAAWGFETLGDVDRFEARRALRERAGLVKDDGVGGGELFEGGGVLDE